MDVLIVAPRPERNAWTLVTSGMSDLPMTTPPGAEQLRRAELMLCLPPSWKMSEPDGRRPEYYWPVQWLKGLARLPHELEMGAGHLNELLDQAGVSELLDPRRPSVSR